MTDMLDCIWSCADGDWSLEQHSTASPVLGGGGARLAFGLLLVFTGFDIMQRE